MEQQIPLTADEDAAMAVQEARAGNLEHALYHIGCALGKDPNRREWLDLLNQIIQAAPDPLQLLPDDERGQYYATLAVRAYIQARAGSLSEAMNLLLQVVTAKPDVLYLVWAAEWIEGLPEGRSIEPAAFQRFLVTFAMRWDDPNFREQAGPTAERVIPFIHLLREKGLANADVLASAASVVRRIGSANEALELAREAQRLDPGYNATIRVGAVLRDMGDVKGAMQSFQEALRYKPHDTAVLLDMGDMLVDHRDLDGAERCYAQVLRREPEQPSALPSSLAVRFQRTMSRDWQDQLQEYAWAHPENDRAHSLARLNCEYFGTYLPVPGEATVNALRGMVEKISNDPGEAPAGPITIRLSSLEAPSSILAFQMQMESMSLSASPEIIVEQVQKPDPRQPRGQVDFYLWKYVGSRPSPAVDPPAPNIASAIAEIARQPYRLDSWGRWSASLGQQLGPARLMDLAGVMVHPPAPPSELPAWLWIPRIQIAAALTIAGLDAGWEGSVRRKALLSLANGPMDWSVDAALIALAWIAGDDAEIETEVAQLYQDLLRSMPHEGYVCYLFPLLCSFMQLPHIPKASLNDLFRRRRALSAGHPTGSGVVRRLNDLFRRRRALFEE